MKKIKLIAALFGLMLLCAGCTTQKFKGKAKANSSHFEMEYSVFTGTKDVTMNLREGEALSIDVEIKKGELKTSVFLAGQSPVYEIEPSKSGNFRVNITKTGTYTIRLKGKKAKGSIEIKVINPIGNTI